jgi:hypothetical protein
LNRPELKKKKKKKPTRKDEKTRSGPAMCLFPDRGRGGGGPGGEDQKEESVSGPIPDLCDVGTRKSSIRVCGM